MSDTDSIYDGLECGSCGEALSRGEWCGNLDCKEGRMAAATDDEPTDSAVNGEVIETEPNAAPPNYGDHRDELSDEKRAELAELDPTLAPPSETSDDDDVEFASADTDDVVTDELVDDGDEFDPDPEREVDLLTDTE
jgi:hypothetical protein